MATQKEKYKAYIKCEEQKALLDQQNKMAEVYRKQEVVRIVADGLGLQTKLQEIRDTIWEEGDVQIAEYPDSSNYTLTTSWPVFCRYYQSVGHNEGSYESTQVEKEVVSLAIRLQVRDNTDHTVRIYKWQPEKSLPYPGEREGWDGKTVEVCFSSGTEEVKNDWKVINYDNDYKGMIVVDSSRPITQGSIDQVDTHINQALANINKRFPFPLTTSKNNSRQKIIDKVLTGELSRSYIPDDFGYEFPSNPTKPPETIVKSQKKRFNF